MDEYDLLCAWFRVADWAAYEMAKEGAEAIVLKPLGGHSKAAGFIARLGSGSLNFHHRKLAASLAGWIQRPPLDLLAQIFEQEADRDKHLPMNDFGRLESQSVVEEIVFSASLWARSDYTRSSGFQLLRDVVKRAIDGEYWNTASYAITTLCRYRAAGCDELLTQFHQFAARPGVDHPSRPSLTQERDFAKNLVANNPKTLETIELLLQKRIDVAHNATLDENSRRAIEDLAQIAQRYDSQTASQGNGG